MLQSSANKFLWYSLKSFYFDKTVNDYLIEYNYAHETVNGKKEPNKDFTFKSYLSNFTEKESKILQQLISYKLKDISKENTVVVETVYV